MNYTRAFKTTLPVLVAASGFLFWRATNVKADDDEADRTAAARIRIGFAIAPVKLDLRGKNPARVGMGSYLVNAQAACADCHSCPTYTPGHNPFPPPAGANGDGQLNPLNYLAGGVPFTLPPPTGTIRSANLTPDASGKPAGLTFDQFLNAIRTGADPDDPHQRLTVMPWAVYRFMTDQDLAAIYEYLSAVPHAEPGACVAPGQ
jgi:cytochrome c553